MSTRDRLIEVARQLFLVKGIENTTIIDIANASENGRRTVYTYFKSKADIYNAVIERESENHVACLREIVEMEIEPEEKLRKFFFKTFHLLRDASISRDSLLSWLTLDFSRAGKIKKAVEVKESELLDIIFREGVRAGVFDVDMCNIAKRLMPSILSAASREAFDLEKNKELETIVEDYITLMLASVKIKNR